MPRGRIEVSLPSSFPPSLPPFWEGEAVNGESEKKLLECARPLDGTPRRRGRGEEKREEGGVVVVYLSTSKECTDAWSTDMPCL
jgi:hypothetical protein